MVWFIKDADPQALGPHVELFRKHVRVEIINHKMIYNMKPKAVEFLSSKNPLMDTQVQCKAISTVPVCCLSMIFIPYIPNKTTQHITYEDHYYIVYL